jgi:2-polyprenyl-3-methyl-5-hydroxy-6-metoxy-1,4-benzoquinol methylase
MNFFTQIDHCLLCDSKQLETVVRLAPIPISTPVLHVPNDMRSDPNVYAAGPLNLNLCLICGQLQVSHVPNVDFEYRNYVYRTSLSLNLREHFHAYAAQVLARYGLKPGALAVEIGSNDGTLSSFYKAAGLAVLGIDPAVRIAEAATAAGIETIAEFFTADLARHVAASRGRADLICANFVTANLENMSDFGEGVAALLADDGILVIETQYGRDVIERNLLDTIYHEHVSYFLLKPLVMFFARHGIEVIDVERVLTKGGSIRLTAQKAGAGRPISPHVADLLAEEARIGAASPRFFDRFTEWNDGLRRELRALVDSTRARGGTVAGWGVSVGTSALLAQFGLEQDVAFLLDDDADKDPYLTGPDYHIPVLPVSALYDKMPDLVVVFAWRYIDPIMKRHVAYLERGGRFVVPLPHISVVASATAASPNYIAL